ncbi:MAG TPA: glycosyltransferase family 4 protein [Bacteroidales bacterium]|nr:glycosyltransferase family 4 protein [Bacteroidales bacterium]HNS45783.1 glycosyltransferase family 4 protein [Bacteroidales bacterium]
MNILILCNKSPFPPKEGGPIAMNAVIEGLIRMGHRVRVLAVNTNKYFVKMDEIPRDYRERTRIETVYIDLSIRPVEAFLNLFSRQSYHIQRFISGEFEQKLIEILSQEEFDIIQLEMLYLTPYLKTIRRYSKARIVLRAHNIEHRIWERIACNCKNPLKRIYLGHIYRTLKRYELSALEQFDGIVAITRNDASFFRKTGTRTPVIDIPFGVHLQDYPKPQAAECSTPSLFHIGAMNWYPNMEGIRWFLDQVWPLIHREFPGLTFTLAGRNIPGWMYSLRVPKLEIVGEVEDAMKFIRSKSIMIVPLFSGSGIRIKIVEGMTAARTIISTPVGAEGIHCENGKNILFASTPEEFVEAVRSCIQDPEKCRTIGNNARGLIEQEHNNDRLMEKLTDFYRSLSIN